ncbi:hypothetical protein AOLI_G00236760 [Acnodon oligacanthus]
MQARLGVEMLAVLVVVSLAASGGEGLTKCELRQELTVTLPATVLDRIKNEMAKIVCNVELIAAFNTSAVTNITIHEKEHGSRHARSASRMASEESSENVPSKPRPGFGSSTIRPTTSSQGNASSAGRAHVARHVKSAYGSNSEESNESKDKQHKPVFGSSTIRPTTSSQGSTSSSKRRRVARHVKSARGSNSKESHANEHNKPQVGFNTSTSTAHPQSNCTGRGHDRHHVRSAHESSSVESNEESSEKSIIPNSANINPPTDPHSNDSFPRGGHGGRHARSTHGSSSEESNEESSEESSEKSIIPNSANITPPTDPHSNDSFPRGGHGGRHARSTHGSSSEESNEESSEESSEDDIMHYFAHIIPPTSSKGNDSLPRRGQGERHARSTHRSSSEESNDPEVWTLYGLFQLPGPVACTSGSGFSLNLCNMTCNSLLNSNITDDISCLGTIINALLPAGKKPRHNENDVLKL